MRLAPHLAVVKNGGCMDMLIRVFSLALVRVATTGTEYGPWTSVSVRRSRVEAYGSRVEPGLKFPTGRFSTAHASIGIPTKSLTSIVD